MKRKNSSSTLLVLAFTFVFGISFVSSDAPSAGNPKAARISIQDVSPYSQVFLSGMKTSPAFDMGNGSILRLELEEPSDDDKPMNAARKAIGETPAVMEAAKKKLANLLKNDSELNVPWQNDAWLIRFLRARKYDVPKTYKLIKSYYNLKAKNGKIYNDLVPSKMRKLAEEEFLQVLPNRDPAGSRIMLIPTKNWDAKKYSVIQCIRLAVTFAETAAYEPATQLAGTQLIFDAGGLTWQHIKQFTPNINKFLIQWITTSAPVPVRGIHIVNQGRIFNALLTLFKPLLTEELRNKIHFHGSDIKSLHRYIPAKSLPDTYGGSFPRPSLSSYEWDVLLKAADEEIAKIESYGIKRDA